MKALLKFPDRDVEIEVSKETCLIYRMSEVCAGTIIIENATSYIREYIQKEINDVAIDSWLFDIDPLNDKYILGDIFQSKDNNYLFEAECLQP